MNVFDPTMLLFVPGDRPERFEKAVASEASGAILDLEDAVSVENKATARAAVARYLDGVPDPSRIAVRVNAPHSPWFVEDLEMLQSRRLAAVVLPKAPSFAALNAVLYSLPHVDAIALIESAQGVLHAGEIAAHPRCLGLAFGPFDLAADLACSDEWEVLLPFRMQVLLAARAAGKRAIDGPTLVFTNPTQIEKDVRAAFRVGYDAKLLIHPAQIAPARKAFMPNREQIDRATRILEVSKQGAVSVIDGMMIDQPIITAAQRIMDRARVYTP